MALLLAAALSACATVPTPLPPTVAVGADERVETRPLPPDAASEALPAGTPPEDWVEPLEVGSCLDKARKALPKAAAPCPGKSGVSLSESRAARLHLFQIRYPELRKLYEADRTVWVAQRELYEMRLQQADTKLRQMEPTWFQQHAFQLGMTGGFVLGIGLTLATAYAVRQASK